MATGVVGQKCRFWGHWKDKFAALDPNSFVAHVQWHRNEGGLSRHLSGRYKRKKKKMGVCGWCNGCFTSEGLNVHWRKRECGGGKTSSKKQTKRTGDGRMAVGGKKEGLEDLILKAKTAVVKLERVDLVKVEMRRSPKVETPEVVKLEEKKEEVKPMEEEVVPAPPKAPAKRALFPTQLMNLVRGLDRVVQQPKQKPKTEPEPVPALISLPEQKKVKVLPPVPVCEVKKVSVAPLKISPNKLLGLVNGLERAKKARKRDEEEKMEVPVGIKVKEEKISVTLEEGRNEVITMKEPVEIPVTKVELTEVQDKVEEELEKVTNVEAENKVLATNTEKLTEIPVPNKEEISIAPVTDEIPPVPDPWENDPITKIINSLDFSEFNSKPPVNKVKSFPPPVSSEMSPPHSKKTDYPELVLMDMETGAVTPYSKDNANASTSSSQSNVHPPNLFFSVNGEVVMPVFTLEMLRHVSTEIKHHNFEPQDNDSSGEEEEEVDPASWEEGKEPAELEPQAKGVKSRKSYKCSFCKRICQSQGALSIHLRTHTGEKPFLCPVCGKRFSQKGDFVRHLTSVHSRPKGPAAKLRKSLRMSRVCPLCPVGRKGYSNRNKLKDHVWAAHPEVLEEKPEN